MNYISRSLLGRAVDGGMERSLASNLSFCVTGKCTGLLQPWMDILFLNINGSLWTDFKWRNGGRQTWRRVGKNPVCIVYPAMLEGSLVEKVENTHPCLQSDTSPGTGTGPPPSQGMTNPGLGWTRDTRGIEKCWFTFQIIWFIMYAVWRTRCLSGQLPTPATRLPGFSFKLAPNVNKMLHWTSYSVLCKSGELTRQNKTRYSTLSY